MNFGIYGKLILWSKVPFQSCLPIDMVYTVLVDITFIISMGGSYIPIFCRKKTPRASAAFAHKGKLTWQRKTNDLKIYFLLKMVISPACHISFRGVCFPKKVSRPESMEGRKLFEQNFPMDSTRSRKICVWRRNLENGSSKSLFYSKKNRLEWSFQGLLKENDGSMTTLNCFWVDFYHHPRPPFQTNPGQATSLRLPWSYVPPAGAAQRIWSPNG